MHFKLLPREIVLLVTLYRLNRTPDHLRRGQDKVKAKYGLWSVWFRGSVQTKSSECIRLSIELYTNLLQSCKRVKIPDTSVRASADHMGCQVSSQRYTRMSSRWYTRMSHTVCDIRQRFNKNVQKKRRI
jgi:hypothetical protein